MGCWPSDGSSATPDGVLVIYHTLDGAEKELLVMFLSIVFIYVAVLWCIRFSICLLIGFFCVSVWFSLLFFGLYLLFSHVCFRL